ncbi:subpellicular microtubule protein 1, putative [Plasmodium berghei]|uniref:Subpellicular microtubule protein 1, putative n=1 Tax=Plasmodium berghei TaxID=5821 RepID=A0A1C6YC87_PLABE|nr:subpellicular microtubule protein 1, putative [Plasmodium berghei]
MEIIGAKPSVNFNFFDEETQNNDNLNYMESTNNYDKREDQDYFYSNRRTFLDKNSENRRKESPSKKLGLCVDEICTCGFHRCPKIIKPLPFEGESNYRSEFGPKPLPELPPRVETKLVKSLPFEGESNYRSEFGPKPLPEIQPRVENKPHKTLPFEGESNYRSEFGPKPLPELPPRVETKLVKSLPFEGESYYRSEFGPKPLPEIQPRVENKPHKTLPFEGESNYRTEYVRKVIPICPVNLLPKYPAPTYPAEHIFWDDVKKAWY